MSENTKKGLLAGVIVLALAIAGYSVINYSAQDKMVIQNKVSMPPGYKSEKEKALEEQAKGGVPDAGKGEKDLGG